MKQVYLFLLSISILSLNRPDAQNTFAPAGSEWYHDMEYAEYNRVKETTTICRSFRAIRHWNFYAELYPALLYIARAYRRQACRASHFLTK